MKCFFLSKSKGCKTGQLFRHKGAADPPVGRGYLWGVATPWAVFRAARSKLNPARNTAHSDTLNHKFGTCVGGKIWHFLGPKISIWSSMANIGWWNFQPGRFSRCWARWVLLERRRRWKNTFLRPISNFGRISSMMIGKRVNANASTLVRLNLRQGLRPWRSFDRRVWGASPHPLAPFAPVP